MCSRKTDVEPVSVARVGLPAFFLSASPWYQSRHHTTERIPARHGEVNLDTRLKERTGDTCTYANPIAYLATLAPVTSFLDPWHALYME